MHSIQYLFNIYNVCSVLGVQCNAPCVWYMKIHMRFIWQSVLDINNVFFCNRPVYWHERYQQTVRTDEGRIYVHILYQFTLIKCWWQELSKCAVFLSIWKYVFVSLNRLRIPIYDSGKTQNSNAPTHQQ